MAVLSAEMAERAGRTYRGATIAWGRGECYDFDNPNPEIITIEDIAYALAFTPRWRGQTVYRRRRVFFGVGQHCVFGAEEMLAAGHSGADALSFLLHEDDEVVLPDFPGPAKMSVPGLKAFAKRQGAALSSRLDHVCTDPDLMKLWDLRMMVTEKRDLMPGHEGDTFHTSDRVSIHEDVYQPFDRPIVPYHHPAVAALRWMNLYRELGGKP